MDSQFSTLVDSYLEYKVGIVENFLSPALALHLKENLIALFHEKRFKPAGTGNEKEVRQDKSIRSDQIFWLDRKHNNNHENDFFTLMDSFVSYLNRTCYAGITGYEFHYTLYEMGSFYKKHKDQFRNDKGRAYSMIIYLNADWQVHDGGELCIHHPHHQQIISPTEGKSVFFKSDELEHEVLLTHSSRMSITGWLKVG